MMAAAYSAWWLEAPSFLKTLWKFVVKKERFFVMPEY